MDKMTMEGVSSRETSYRFILLDQSLAEQGEIHPDTSNAPTITNNINRTIKRSLDGLRVLPEDVGAIDVLRDRLRVYASIDSGDTWYPLGTFIWTDNPGSLRSFGYVGDNALVDFGGILDQPLGRPVSYTTGQSVDTALRDLALEVGLSNQNLVTTSHSLSGPMSWAPDVSRAEVMSQLAHTAGCYSPYFDGLGALTTIRPPGLGSADLIYNSGPTSRIKDGSILISNDLLKAPNRWLAISSGANESAVWATYTVPADAPHSFENRGFYITVRIDAQGATTTDEAYEVAKAAALSDDNTYEWVEFEAIPDFRHDTFNVVEFLETIYREQEWSLPLQATATMKHSLRRHYE